MIDPAYAERCSPPVATVKIELVKKMLEQPDQIPELLVEVEMGKDLLWSITNRTDREVEVSFVEFHEFNDSNKKKLDVIDFPGIFNDNDRTIKSGQTETLCGRVKNKTAHKNLKVKYTVQLDFKDNGGQTQTMLHDPRLDIKEPAPFDKGKGKGGARP